MMYRSHRIERRVAQAVGHVGLHIVGKRPNVRLSLEPHAARALRAFYRKALKGRQVWPAGIESRASLWFLVAGVLIEVTDAAGAKRSVPIVLDVEDPDALARRCWDAGFTVRVNQDADAAPVSVFDPFGRRIDLVEANREDVTASRVRQR